MVGEQVEPAAMGRARGEMDRREFLRRGAIGGLGILFPLSGGEGVGAGSQAPRVRRYVRLGRTGLRISDISFGASRLSGDERLVLHALDRGINYFDTAAGYARGESEATLGKALQGRRERVVLGTKVKCRPGDSRKRLMEALEVSLRRLRTDHVDIYFNHAVNDLARLQNAEWYEFAERARAQGKIRFTGISGHGGRLIECLEYALGNGQADVILVAYNFGQDPAFYERFTADLDFVARQPDLPRVLAKAKRKGLGVIAMKTLMGARLNDMRPYEREGGTFAQAAFRWVLSSPDVDALVVTMKSREAVDEYLGASGSQRPRRADLSLLARYLQLNGRRQCRYGCSACVGACAERVPIADVMRARMYARDYRDIDLARSEYADLGQSASVCLRCVPRPCAGACPYGLRIDELAASTHRWLTGAV